MNPHYPHHKQGVQKRCVFKVPLKHLFCYCYSKLLHDFSTSAERQKDRNTLNNPWQLCRHTLCMINLLTKTPDQNPLLSIPIPISTIFNKVLFISSQLPPGRVRQTHVPLWLRTRENKKNPIHPKSISIHIWLQFESDSKSYHPWGVFF